MSDRQNWNEFDRIGLVNVRKLLINDQMSPQIIKNAKIWIEHQESTLAASSRAATVDLAKESNAIAQEANSFARAANSLAEAANALSDRALERTSQANRLAAAAMVIAAISLAFSVMTTLHKW